MEPVINEVKALRTQISHEADQPKAVQQPIDRPQFHELENAIIYKRSNIYVMENRDMKTVLFTVAGAVAGLAATSYAANIDVSLMVAAALAKAASLTDFFQAGSVLGAGATAGAWAGLQAAILHPFIPELNDLVREEGPETQVMRSVNAVHREAERCRAHKDIDMVEVRQNWDNQEWLDQWVPSYAIMAMPDAEARVMPKPFQKRLLQAQILTLAGDTNQAKLSDYPLWVASILAAEPDMSLEDLHDLRTKTAERVGGALRLVQPDLRAHCFGDLINVAYHGIGPVQAKALSLLEEQEGIMHFDAKEACNSAARRGFNSIEVANEYPDQRDMRAEIGRKAILSDVALPNSETWFKQCKDGVMSNFSQRHQPKKGSTPAPN